MAGPSIYSVPNWNDLSQSTSTVFEVNDIVRYNNLYYYSKIRQSRGLTFDSTKWMGIINYNGSNHAHFEWTPSYNSKINIRPDVREVRFGDSYRQVSQSNINSILLPFNLSFDRRTNNEARAILHFLDARKGNQSFNFIPPFPFNATNKFFICRDWSHQIIFEGNNSIECLFEENIV